MNKLRLREPNVSHRTAVFAASHPKQQQQPQKPQPDEHASSQPPLLVVGKENCQIRFLLPAKDVMKEGRNGQAFVPSPNTVMIPVMPAADGSMQQSPVAVATAVDYDDEEEEELLYEFSSGHNRSTQWSTPTVTTKRTPMVDPHHSPKNSIQQENDQLHPASYLNHISVKQPSLLSEHCKPPIPTISWSSLIDHAKTLNQKEATLHRWEAFLQELKCPTVPGNDIFHNLQFRLNKNHDSQRKLLQSLGTSLCERQVLLQEWNLLIQKWEQKLKKSLPSEAYPHYPPSMQSQVHDQIRANTQTQETLILKLQASFRQWYIILCEWSQVLHDWEENCKNSVGCQITPMRSNATKSMSRIYKHTNEETYSNP